MEKSWAEIRKLAGECAIENMDRGMNCAESVFEALIRSGAVDVPQETVAYATGFGGGGGSSGMTCGALSSAILANNIVHGRKDPSQMIDRSILKKEFYPRYNKIVSEFVRENSSGLCHELIGRYENGYQDENARSGCIRACETAAQIAVDFIQMDAAAAAKLEYDVSVIKIKNW